MNQPATESKFKLGDWVRVSERNYGIVKSVYDTGAIIVDFPNGEKLTLDHLSLKIGAPTTFYHEILEHAKEGLSWDQAHLNSCHRITAGARELMSLEVLYQLNRKIEDAVALHTKPVFSAMKTEWDSKGIEIRGKAPSQQKRLTLKQFEKEITAAEIACDTRLLEFLNNTKEFILANGPAGVANISEDLAELITEFVSSAPANPRKSRSKPKPVTGAASQVVDFPAPAPATLEATQEAVAAYNDIFGTIEQTAEAIDNDIFAQFGLPETAESVQPATPEAVNAEPLTEPQVDILDALEESIEKAKQQAEPIRTDAGKTDPGTGEVLDESLILRKFGWTAMPSLPTDREPTPEELSEFEAKIDQVAERCAAQKQTAARWRAQVEKKCKPLDDTSNFWESQFVLPMSELLAAHRLPKFQSGARKGEYSKKTLHLSSCSIKFTAGGGYYQHDPELVRKHIEEKGVEQFLDIGAKQVINYDWKKLISALKKGTLKDIPGTGHRPETPFAKASMVIPGVSGKDEEVSESEE